MRRKIAINSQSTGKFTTEVINNRPHLVTQMVSIEGDSIMNGLLYPLSQVTSAHPQLDALLAPANHPQVNGVNVSAFHPLAINAFNVGGMVKNPRMVGNQVVNDLVFDIEVAEKDERGVEIMNRIKKGESIGVSTGLNATVTKQNGKIGNTEFGGIVSDIKFDHVAILLDEPPAGDNTFTINTEDVTICNLADSVNELMTKVREAAREKFGSEHTHVWLADVLIDPDRAIIEIESPGDTKTMSVPFGYNDAGDVVFTDSGFEVEEKRIFEPVGDTASLSNSNQGEDDMDKRLEFVLALIGNASNRYTMADKDKLLALSETDLVGDIHNNQVQPDITVELAQAAIEGAGMTVNGKDFDKDGYAAFVANKSEFDTFLAGQAEVTTKKVEHIIANSNMSEEQVRAMAVDAIDSLYGSLNPAIDYSLQGQGIHNKERSGQKAAVDYTS